MNKITEMAGKMMAKTALKLTSANANSTCYYIAYQPKMPAVAEKLCKNK